MIVTLIAQTHVNWHKLMPLVRGTRFGDEAYHELGVKSADHLAEFAGRACYKSFDRKNPATNTTAKYLRSNILDHGHYSVLEHASFTFYVQHVSRSFLAEIRTHRHLSFSAESQRYVDQSKSHPEPVIPPDVVNDREETNRLRNWYKRAMLNYQLAYDDARMAGIPNKRARSLARAFLPNCTPVDLVITGNVRAWREVIEKRSNPDADEEIKQFAEIILSELKRHAPLSVQDL